MSFVANWDSEGMSMQWSFQQRKKSFLIVKYLVLMSFCHKCSIKCSIIGLRIQLPQKIVI